MNEHACKRHPVLLPIILVLVLGGFYLGGKYIEGQDLRPVTISVQGEGKVMAIPDIAQMSFGVETGRQKTAEIAMEILSEKMNAVFEAAKELNIEEKDITTESLSLRPSYDWEEGKRTDQGFEASQSLRVKIRDMDKIGEVLAAVTAAGANQAGGVNFTIDEPEELQAQAREKAIDNGEEKARELAAQLGKSLGKLKSFGEGGGGMPRYDKVMAMDMEAGMGGGGPVPSPVPTGEQEVQVFVTLTYELK